MKILLTRAYPNAPNHWIGDYLSDGVLHGLRAIMGNDVIDSPPIWYMYKNNFGKDKENLNSMYGKGFTIFGTLTEDQNDIDRTDIENKIKSKFFNKDLFLRNVLSRSIPNSLELDLNNLTVILLWDVNFKNTYYPVKEKYADISRYYK